MNDFDRSKRWVALYVLCTGVLMIVLDTTIVTVALPSIQADLHLEGAGLTWVLNAYMLTFGGFLLLGGRLGDLYGQRKLFLLGLVLFTLASLACGVAHSQFTLIASRAIQGVGGAVVTAVALSLVLTLFTEGGDRAKAMGVYGFVTSAGGCIGELVGGALTNALGWHSIFLINLPIGAAVYAWCARGLPPAAAQAPRRLDVAGAVTVTCGLMLAVYGVVGGNAAGWTSPQTTAPLGAAVVLLAIFLAIEARVRDPLMPLRLFRRRNIATSNVLAVLWAAGMFGWFVVTALYLQRILGYDPFRVGIAFLPVDLIVATFSLGLSAKVVMRFGIRGPASVGLALQAIGLALFARAPADGTFLVDVLPGMALIGFGAGMAFNPVLLAAMNDVDESESGLASGVVNTSFMMGGALGLAALAALADARTARLASGLPETLALLGGYQRALLIAALLTAAGAVLAVALLRPRQAPPAREFHAHA